MAGTVISIGECNTEDCMSNWIERARRGAREYGLIQHPSSSFRFIRSCPFVSIFTVAFASPQQLFPQGRRPREAGRKDLDGTTQMDTDGQKRRGTFYSFAESITLRCTREIDSQLGHLLS